MAGVQASGGGQALKGRHEPDRVAPWALGFVALVTSLVVFSRQVFWPPWTKDFSQHVEFARALCRGGGMPPHFLFDLLVCGLAAPVDRDRAFDVAAVAVATAAVVAKVILTYRRIREEGGIAIASFAALALLFAMPLFNWWKFPDPYLGQVSPNVWHNPTTIAVLPLALLLFHAAARSTLADRLSVAAATGALALFVCLTKPNYLLALLPCWVFLLAGRSRPAFQARRVGWGRTALVFALLLAPTAGVLAWQVSRLAATGSGVAFSPFEVWRFYSPDIPASILLSIAFPGSVLALYFGVARRQAPLTLAWSVLFVAVLQMALLAERGPRLTDANFFWGSYTANYLLFVESAVVLAAAPRSWRSRAAWGLLGAHALVGVFYTARLAVGAALF